MTTPAFAADNVVRSRIWAAASAGNVEELIRIQGMGYSLEMLDVHQNTPYCQAVLSQNRTAVATLKAAGANVRPWCLKRINYVEMGAIYGAARSEDLAQLVNWKKEGLNIDVTDPKSGNTALCQAVYDGDCDAINILLKAGASQGAPCMRRIPKEVREDLNCRPMVINWRAIGYTTLGLGLTGAFVGVFGSGDNKGDPTCLPDERWRGDRCVSCATCWMGDRCISEAEMNDTANGGKYPYYRDEYDARCWQVAEPPIQMTSAEFEQKRAEIEEAPGYDNGYLKAIGASAAYARGYTGYVVNRKKGKYGIYDPYGRLNSTPVGPSGTPDVSSEKVRVAVYSAGMNIGHKVIPESSSNTSNPDAPSLPNQMWSWNGVNSAFYHPNNDEADEFKKWTGYDGKLVPLGKDTPDSDTSAKPLVDLKAAALGDIKTNIATQTSGTPFGYNFDYGAKTCSDTVTTNCYKGTIYMQGWMDVKKVEASADGTVVVESYSDKPDADIGFVGGGKTIQLEAGKTYYVFQQTQQVEIDGVTRNVTQNMYCEGYGTNCKQIKSDGGTSENNETITIASSGYVPLADTNVLFQPLAQKVTDNGTIFLLTDSLTGSVTEGTGSGPNPTTYEDARTLLAHYVAWYYDGTNPNSAYQKELSNALSSMEGAVSMSLVPCTENPNSAECKGLQLLIQNSMEEGETANDVYKKIFEGLIPTEQNTFKDVSLNSGVIWDNAQVNDDYVYNKDDPSLHLKNTNNVGTYMAAIVAGMNNTDGTNSYGVAYNAEVLPVFRSMLESFSKAAAEAIASDGKTDILVWDSNFTTASSLGLFNRETNDKYVLRNPDEVFGTGVKNIYNVLTEANILTIVPTGGQTDLEKTEHSEYVHIGGNVPSSSKTEVWSDSEGDTEVKEYLQTGYVESFSQEAGLFSAVPFIYEYKDSADKNLVWTGNAEDATLPTLSDDNPLKNLFITVGGVDVKYNADGTVDAAKTQLMLPYDVEEEGDSQTLVYNKDKVVSQPCGIAGSYCLVAPGKDLTVPGTGDKTEVSGSGYAAAVVAGAAAVVKGAYPHLSNQEVAEILFATATYLNPNEQYVLGEGETGKTVAEVIYGDSGYGYAGAEDKDSSGFIYQEGETTFANGITGKYNSVYGYGLVNLDAATNPIYGKTGLWVPEGKRETGPTQTAVAKTNLLMPSLVATKMSELPETFVAFDYYARPFQVPTQMLFNAQTRRKTKSLDDFKAFMSNQDPIEVSANETFSMKYRMQSGNRVTSDLDLPMGFMEMSLKHNKMRYGLFYTQDTTMGRDAYWKRRSANPFIQMKNAYGVETGYELNTKWSIEAGWMSGENGFFDDERFFDAPENKMQAFTSSVVFKPTKKLSLKLGGGVMSESGSSLGMVSDGAFEIKGAKTQFVSAGVSYQPTDKISLEATYSYGITRSEANGSLMNFGRLHSDSFALTASYRPDENALFGLSVSSPLRVRKGKMNISLPVGRHPTEDIFYYDTYQADMKPEKREIDFSLYYQGDITDEFEVKSELGVRLNPDHQQDAEPDYRGMIGIKLKI